MTGNLPYTINSVTDYRLVCATALSRLSSHPDTSPSDAKSDASQSVQDGHFPSLSIDLGKVYTLESLVITGSSTDHGYRNRTLAVEISRDGNDWALLHGGLRYWEGTLTVPVSGAATGRYLRFGLTERTPLYLEKIQINVRMFEDGHLPIFASRRSDGLGERLNGLLNAIWLAEIFGSDFKFYWSDKFADDPMHAIVSGRDMFSEEFLAKHHTGSLKSPKGWAIEGKKLKRELVDWKLSQTGVIESPRDHLSNYFANIPEIADRDGLRRAFQRIGFSKRVDDAIKVANATKIPESAIALHLRSGDIFYGIYRKHLNYSYKGITTPVAKLIITKFINEGRAVFLFGQDAEQLEYLALTCGAIDTTSLNRDAVAAMEPHQKAMYDLVLLSRFQTILAGTSAFSRQASWVGGGQVIIPNKVFTADEQHRASLEDLENNAHLYHPQQAAYSYWYAYHHGRHERDIEINIKVLRQALAFDPENELYYFVLSALLARKGDIRQSADVLEILFERHRQAQTLRNLFPIFALKKSKNEYKLKEYFADFIRVADEGSFFHSVLIFFLARSKGEIEEMETYFSICCEAAADASAVERAVLNYITPRMELARKEVAEG